MIWSGGGRVFGIQSLQEMAQVIAMANSVAGLYAANFLCVLFAVLLPVDTLSGEIHSGIMQTLASKPVRRAEILLGKWLGHATFVAGYLLMLTGGVVIAMRAIGGFSPSHLEIALPLMLLEVLLLMAVTIAGGTRLTTVTNGGSTAWRSSAGGWSRSARSAGSSR